MSTNASHDQIVASPGGRSLAWLADAPMFIDAEQVAALYNAVAKPEHETEKITLSLKDTKQFEMEGTGKVGLEVGLADWLKTVFPFLDAKATAEVEGTVKGGSEKEKGSEIELRPINTPQRQLVQLGLHYLLNLSHRTKIVDKSSNADWLGSVFISALPRGLVFVDFPPGTKFVPMAAEVEGGSVHLIYDELKRSFVGPDVAVPNYTDPASKKFTPADVIERNNKYWKFFEEYFNATLAMEAIEKQVADGGKSIQWIDFRVPLGEGLPCLHFSVTTHGNYDTGTFAYRLVKRGFKHGLRVVGTMKSEPAMNVLAIFER